jgi:hypothetical protein
MTKKAAKPTAPRPAEPAGKLPAAAPAASTRAVISEDEIRQRAYQRWQAAGAPAGDGALFWLEAEQELRQRK